jgi:hypothetical protein
LQCHEETEQAQGAKALAPEEAWGKAVARVKAEAVAEARAATAFAPAVVNGSPIGKESPALRKNALSAGLI